MRFTFLVSFLFAVCLNVAGQISEETYPKTLWCENDTFTIAYKGFDRKFPRKVSSTTESDSGTDATMDDYATLYYGKDSIRIKYHNRVPYGQNVYFNIESPKGKTRFRLHFNEINCYFPPDYIKKNTGSIQFDIPESYELANIIWTLSPGGQRATDLNKQNDYFKEVAAYFKPWMDHPVLKSLDFPDSIYYDKYYQFRENSFAFNFDKTLKNNRLLFNGPYYYVFGDELADSSLFGKMKPLAEDFAAKSKFREFYQKHLLYYKKAIARQQQLLPVRQMWTWLEGQFPGRQFQSYRIVFSPLIGGSHSTQQYHAKSNDGWFSENVMFICGTDRYDSVTTYTEKQREGLMSGIVFTEIDHNYVNPTTSKFRATVDSIFSNRDYWVKPGISKGYYGSPSSVFNEYMTQAAFCLYVDDDYDKETADLVIQKREEMMAGPRNFSKFREFNQELMKLFKGNKPKKLVDLYPAILEWCKKQGS
ncbi:DUF4932 domain-containing protein [Terrimonas sp. NA20]|uniref:DUF4932 domain-containing protein n=1 Tax=Terrimonas ginsenosidimutans TaxID=2908004 RepID=A0ABS9KN81_9BACT|nr:DUF4932 domain-containing protein [Terrimonas ginsenosidimutans]MCG2613778.1 DUF4932 domain-containing protein [Terrimonas ginsenosidimutans]